ncbi:hypothetical protein Y1Q_0013236 [Alligator mississippiensis]|uniref:Uncharacterized protein n=1 Tax=Alligator mississippiensis TaxID=8496 RepID=A0A151NU19_ALLMI|nr:hypothetical protein Y1Q_0013236 [Alligator mississippiensis]
MPISLETIARKMRQFVQEYMRRLWPKWAKALVKIINSLHSLGVDYLKMVIDSHVKQLTGIGISWAERSDRSLFFKLLVNLFFSGVPVHNADSLLQRAFHLISSRMQEDEASQKKGLEKFLDTRSTGRQRDSVKKNALMII